MTSNSTKLRLAFLSTLAALLMGALVFAFYKLRADNLETARILGVSQESEKEDEEARAIRELRENAGADIEAFEAMVLSSETLVSTIESIESAGRALGLTTKIASVEKEDAGAVAAQTVKIVIESDGSWRGNFSLLKALENLPQRAKIENVYLSKAESFWRSRIQIAISSFD